MIEKNNQELNDEINTLKNNLNIKIEEKIQNIQNHYLNKIKNKEIININHLNHIHEEIENKQKQFNLLNIKLHELDLDKENIEPKVDNLMKIEEEIVNNNEKIVNLKNLEKSMNLAKMFLERAYEKMKNTVTPKFTENLSKNISQITNGKYTNVMVQNDNGLIVELENGNYVEANRFSVGTIDQLYLSLRLSMTEDLSKEKMPIILDEAFAYYDTNRLENILIYLANTYPDRQMIIFTCTEREKDILNKFQIPYQYMDLQES